MIKDDVGVWTVEELVGVARPSHITMKAIWPAAMCGARVNMPLEEGLPASQYAGPVCAECARLYASRRAR